MADEGWRRRRDEDDFGPPLFADEPTGQVPRSELSFGDGDTGPLPHWTEPPTGEMPRLLSKPAEHDDVDVWSSFSDQGPVWGDDSGGTGGAGGYADPPPARDPSGSMGALDDPYHDESAPVRREPGRIQIGTDPTGGEPRPAPAGRRRPGESAARGSRRPVAGPRGGQRRPVAATASAGGRDMPTAVAVGLGIAALFLVAVRWKPEAALAIAVLVLGLAAVEFFDKVTEKGYQPATIAGILACVAMPLAAWWVGPGAIPLVVVLTLLAACVTFLASHGIEANPLPNAAITMLGVSWVGVLGGFAGLILRWSKFGGPVGTDTLTLIAVGVALNDIGAFFVGRAVGRRPLRAWVSPGKTVEGFLGGTVLTVVAMLLVGAFKWSDSWTKTSHLFLLGVVIAIAAPLGDLVESMFKRNLDIKDFGTLVRGHGGVLDRFDGYLFTLPAVYYLAHVLFHIPASL